MSTHFTFWVSHPDREHCFRVREEETWGRCYSEDWGATSKECRSCLSAHLPSLHGPWRGDFHFCLSLKCLLISLAPFFFFFCISRGYRPGLRHPSPLRSISSCVFYPFFSGREIIWTVKRRAGRCCCYHQNHCCEFLEEQVTQATRAREKQQTPQLPCDQKFYYVLLSITLVVYFDMKIVLIGRKAGPRANFLILLPSRI